MKNNRMNNNRMGNNTNNDVSLKKAIGVLLAVIAVMAYTVINYAKGNTPQGTFLVYMILLLIPFMNMLNILIREWKKR